MLLWYKTNPLQILNDEARKEFLNFKIGTTYLSYQRELVSQLKKATKNDKEKIREALLEAEQKLSYLDQHDFERFLGLRFAIYGCMIAIAIFGLSTPTFQQYYPAWLTPHSVIKGSTTLFVLMFLSLNYVSNKQKQQVRYLKFKYNCLKELL